MSSILGPLPAATDQRISSTSLTPTSSPPTTFPAGQSKSGAPLNACSQTATPGPVTRIRPSCSSRRLPGGQLEVEVPAGAMEQKTSARWEPVEVSEAPSSKTSRHFLLAQESGNTNVTRVVMSDTESPFLLTRPKSLP